MEIKMYKSLIFKALFNLCLFVNFEANSQVIPNGSFENWTSQTVNGQTIQTADNWLGTYTQTSTPLSPTRTTDNVDGNYGIELETTKWPLVSISGGMVASTFPLTTKPLFINGYYKSLRVDTTGSGQVLIRLKNNGINVGEALFATTNSVSTYTPFSKIITYTSNLTPNEATIWLSSEGIFGVNTKSFGNKLWIDNLSLTNAPLSINNNIDKEDLFLIFPNPARDILNIKLKHHNFASLKITNVLGQNLISEILDTENNSVNITGLESGIYIAELKIADKIFVTRIMKE